MIDFLTPHPEYENKRQKNRELQEEICALLCERDHLRFQSAPVIEAQYRVRIGVLECKAFEFQCDVLKLKRKIELVQTALNHQETPQLDRIEEILAEEETQYAQKLETMKTQVADALKWKSNATMMTPEKSAKIKKIYYRIVRKLHPDVNPDVTESDKALLQTAMSAFEYGSLMTLEAVAATLETIVPTVETPSAMEELDQEHQRLTAIRDHVCAEIERIKTSFPFDQLDLLADEKKIEACRAHWKETIAAYKETYAQLTERLSRLLSDSGQNGEQHG